MLELNNSVPESLSKYLRDFSQFLLSEKVEYCELDEYGIKGASGHLTFQSGIFIPKSLEADSYFR